jgi:protein-S-isoprenylcysteine O-methyltransferase Ste14
MVLVMTSWKKFAQKTRVPFGTVLGIFFLWKMHPSVKSLWIGGVIALVGALLRLWAAGHIEKGKVLTQGGPYAFARNPLYLGSFFMAFGIIMAGQGYWLLLPFAAFFALFYLPVMRAEEQELLNGYGERFLEYSRRVPLFVPGFRKTAPNSSTFLWSRVFRNREHHTVAGLIIVEVILILYILVPRVFFR